MITKPLIFISAFLFVAISAIIYFASIILLELSTYKILFIIFAFSSLWFAVQFFIKSLITIIKAAQYKIAKSKYDKN